MQPYFGSGRCCMNQQHPIPQRGPVVDLKTGMLTREWVIFFERRFGIEGTKQTTSAIVEASDNGPVAVTANDMQQALGGIESQLNELSIAALQQDIQNLTTAINQLNQQTFSDLRQELQSLKTIVNQVEQGLLP
jgi:hypothetical protein